MNIEEIKVSDDNTHHLLNNKPLYKKRFTHVLKFHQPGLAPVIDNSSAYHIKVNGEPAYSKRFIRTFGFYFDKAAVITEDGWSHIDARGELIYTEKYQWVGNYQNNICMVRNKDGHYFHIDHHGNRLYNEDMLYAGDFRDDIAVIRKQNGLCTHIYSNGKLIHNKYFIDLDVYHKGFARARDKKGWFHINLDSKPCYKHRFMMIEPFYNGFALVEDFEFNKLIINEKGEVIHKIVNIKDLIE